MKFYITIALASIAALVSAEEIEEGGDPLSSGIEEFADGLNQTFIVIEEETNDL